MIQGTNHWRWSLNVMGSEASWMCFNKGETCNKMWFRKFTLVTVGKLN